MHRPAFAGVPAPCREVFLRTPLAGEAEVVQLSTVTVRVDQHLSAEG
jgi:hypothetical protein